MMDQQSWPLEMSRSCLEPELLRAALTDVAPSAARARVLQAIDAAPPRASATEPESLRGTAISGKATSSPAALSVGIPIDAINPARVAPRQVCAPLAPRRFGRFLPAIQLAAAVAVGVGTAAGARVLSPHEPLVPDASPSRSTGGVTNTLVTQGPRRGLELPAPMNEEARRPRVARSTPERAPSPAEPPPEDWLGEQLSILSQADRSLRDGKSEEALRSLEKYATLFPMGLLDPQVALLRQRARLGEERQVFIFP